VTVSRVSCRCSARLFFNLFIHHQRLFPKLSYKWVREHITYAHRLPSHAGIYTPPPSNLQFCLKQKLSDYFFCIRIRPCRVMIILRHTNDYYTKDWRFRGNVKYNGKLRLLFVFSYILTFSKVYFHMKFSPLDKDEQKLETNCLLLWIHSQTKNYQTKLSLF